MTKPSNINEIRIEIDKIDLKILELISQRKDLVTQVVKFKSKSHFGDNFCHCLSRFKAFTHSFVFDSLHPNFVLSSG